MVTESLYELPQASGGDSGYSSWFVLGRPRTGKQESLNSGPFLSAHTLEQIRALNAALLLELGTWDPGLPAAS